MNIFQKVKERVTARQVAEKYGLKVRHNGMACCPFHNDKHPSMKIDRKPNTIQKIINTVKTGDTTNIVAWFLIAIVSLGLIVGLYKKRKMK